MKVKYAFKSTVNQLYVKEFQFVCDSEYNIKL